MILAIIGPSGKEIRMKTIICTKYGASDFLEQKEVENPAIKNNVVMVDSILILLNCKETKK
jgi:hypothetical protein